MVSEHPLFLFQAHKCNHTSKHTHTEKFSSVRHLMEILQHQQLEICINSELNIRTQITDYSKLPKAKFTRIHKLHTK